MTLNTNTGLAAKLLRIMSEVEQVEKRGRNDFHKYDYAMEADIVAAVRAKLIENNILILPEVKTADLRPNQKGDATITTLATRYTFVDTTTGEQIVLDWGGSGEDKGDKGMYKAMTGSQKYILMKLFLMPTGDDPENDTHRKGGRSADASMTAPQRKPNTAPVSQPQPQAQPRRSTASSGDTLTVADIDEQLKQNRAKGTTFTVYGITLSNGERLETVMRDHAKVAREALEKGLAVRIESHADRFGNKLDAIEIIGSPELTDDDIPF